MDFNTNFENIKQQCRICLNIGDINIWNYKVSLKVEHNENTSLCVDDIVEKSYAEIMDIFCNSEDLLNFTEEFPLLCWKCLEDLKFCYTLHEKIKLANVQLKNICEESLNQCIEEEHLIEVKDENEIKETNICENLEEEKISNFQQYKYDSENNISNLNKSSHAKQITPGKNDSFIVTQFIPEALEVSEKYDSNQTRGNDEGSFQPPQHLLTVNLKAVEVKDLKTLDNLALCHPLNAEETEPAIFMCQYCPRAYAKCEYLKTHIHKSHVCKFCTQPFNITEDLFKHIRETHTENKCVICHKMLSSRTNLRHHIKRVHRIKLPAKVTLIDFVKSSLLEENEQQNEVDILQKELEATDVNLNTEYEWENDDCIEMLNE